MLMKALVLLLLSIYAEGTIISTSLGQLRGKSLKTLTGKHAHSFKRVPFAEPPVNSLRFAKPVSKKPWIGLLDATEYGPACMTNMSLSSSIPDWVDEDCLHHNIFTSNSCLRSKSCPVVFFMHGGNLMMDSAVMFDDQTILNTFCENDVVLVIAAFRLGVFSTITFGSDDVIPRNLATYDMINGLEFVQNEIRSFGGNPKDVTVMGHSAGAEQAIQLAFSKVIDPHKRLFHKMIAMSPAIYFADERRSVDLSWELSYRVNVKAVDCLRRTDQFELLRVQRELEVELFYNNRIMMVPPLFHGNELLDFLGETSVSRPLLIGSVRFEIPEDGPWQIQNSKFSNHKFHEFHNPIQVLRKYNSDFDSFKLGELYGFNHSHISQTVFLGTSTVAHSMRKAGGNVFLYSYENPKHAEHTDDLYYLLGTHPFEKDENEKVISKLYVQYFMNFIKTGTPDPQWPPLEADLNNYMHIDVDIKSGLRPHMRNFYNKKVLDYWLRDMVEYDKMLKGDEDDASPRQMISLKSVSSQISEDSRSCSANGRNLFSLLISFLLGLLVCFLLIKCNNRNLPSNYMIIPSSIEKSNSLF
ncbi:unnamed protein product [Auanema sp. JU1783]|nr:unnamed protein product [Auanema sp. JU1783]